MKQNIFAIAAVLALTGCSNGLGLFGSDPADGAGANAAGVNGVGVNGVGINGVGTNSIEFFNTSVGDRVLFVVDQSNLTPEGIATLDAQAVWLANNPGFSAVIEGHADEQGTREYNIALGERRATAVRDYLVSRGIAATRLSTVSFGKEKPLAICSDETCWAQNRRAVTMVNGAGIGS